MIAERYSRDREIGRGGTGSVWLGRDEVLGRPVALKRIGFLPGAESADVERAEREARLSARLNHPHVVAVFDMVEDPVSGEWWLVMEHVDGSNLSEVVRREGRLAPDAAAPLLAQAADALVAAHEAGITHRDVKPSNMLVDATGHVKLTDFGIAKATADPALTQTGITTGSPAYLAPEVARGGRATEAADVWSLGATAFHLLAGRPPYEVGDNLLGTLFRIVNDDPPRLPEAGWMAPLLAGTMVKEPALRWSMQQTRDFLASHARTGTLDSAVPPAGPEATRVLDAVPVDPVPVDATVAAAAPLLGPSTPIADEPKAPASERGSRRPAVLAALGAAAALLLAVVGYSAFAGGDDPDPAGGGSAQVSGTSGQAGRAAAKKPTAKGMEAFIRDYVRTVADDPDRAWTMLTPKFQRESGGLGRYRDFWDDATNGRVLSIDAEPKSLSVSYQVRFDNFDNGPGPTVLDLVFDGETYRINGEHSEGFVPAE